MPWPPSERLLAPLAPWFEAVKRDLPWRAADLDAPHPDPYAVLVSELMLQQTQVATVIPYFRRWMARWPCIEALAQATGDEVHKAWEGLGYYRRARLLHSASKHLSEAGWPGGLEGLRGIPGLGDYSAAAVAAQAFQWPTPALDGNAFRALARLLGLDADPKGHARELRAWLRPALATHGPSRMTQALMELGATVCTPVPDCARCPANRSCEACRMDATHRIPPIVKRREPAASEIWLVAVEAEGRWLLREPAMKGLLAGLWRWPTFPMEPVDQGRAAEALHPFSALEFASWPAWTQVYTHRRERVHPLRANLPRPIQAPPGLAWVGADELDALPMGKRDLRLKGLARRDATDSQEAALPAPAPLLARLADLLGGAGI